MKLSKIVNDPALFERLQHEIGRQPLHAWLGVKALSASEDGVAVSLSCQPQFVLENTSVYHGGVLAALIDIVGHAAVAVPLGHAAPTIDLRIDYLRPAPAENLYVIGKALRLGRALGRADVEIYDSSDKLCVVGRGVFSTSTP